MDNRQKSLKVARRFIKKLFSPNIVQATGVLTDREIDDSREGAYVVKFDINVQLLKAIMDGNRIVVPMEGINLSTLPLHPGDIIAVPSDGDQLREAPIYMVGMQNT
jgi:hypothetical protein